MTAKTEYSTLHSLSDGNGGVQRMSSDGILAHDVFSQRLPRIERNGASKYTTTTFSPPLRTNTHEIRPSAPPASIGSSNNTYTSVNNVRTDIDEDEYPVPIEVDTDKAMVDAIPPHVPSHKARAILSSSSPNLFSHRREGLNSAASSHIVRSVPPKPKSPAPRSLRSNAGSRVGATQQRSPPPLPSSKPPLPKSKPPSSFGIARSGTMTFNRPSSVVNKVERRHSDIFVDEMPDEEDDDVDSWGEMDFDLLITSAKQGSGGTMLSDENSGSPEQTFLKWHTYNSGNSGSGGTQNSLPVQQAQDNGTQLGVPPETGELLDLNFGNKQYFDNDTDVEIVSAWQLLRPPPLELQKAPALLRVDEVSSIVPNLRKGMAFIFEGVMVITTDVNKKGVYRPLVTLPINRYIRCDRLPNTKILTISTADLNVVILYREALGAEAARRTIANSLVSGGESVHFESRRVIANAVSKGIVEADDEVLLLTLAISAMSDCSLTQTQRPNLCAEVRRCINYTFSNTWLCTLLNALNHRLVFLALYRHQKKLACRMRNIKLPPLIALSKAIMFDDMKSDRTLCTAVVVDTLMVANYGATTLSIRGPGTVSAKRFSVEIIPNTFEVRPNSFQVVSFQLTYDGSAISESCPLLFNVVLNVLNNQQGVDGAIIVCCRFRNATLPWSELVDI